MRLKYRDIEKFKYMVVSSYAHHTEIGECACEVGKIALFDDGLLVISEGYLWDGPSGPTIDTKTGMRGSLVHDALYELMRRGLIEQSWREYADKLLRDICLEDGMSKLRADLWYSSVRACAASCAKAGTQVEDEIYCVGKE